MTRYEDDLPAHVVYDKERIPHTLGEVLAKAGKTQLRIAETEKYAHVTYFFNGGEEEPNQAKTVSWYRPRRLLPMTCSRK